MDVIIVRSKTYHNFHLESACLMVERAVEVENNYLRS
jgi:hypothetical protein